MTEVYREKELKQALKEKKVEIKIMGPYADEVFKTYASALNRDISLKDLMGPVLIPGIRLAQDGGLFGGLLGRYLEWYHVIRYEKQELVIGRSE